MASCWVSVLADCLSTYDVPLGVLVRTLCVISERLHGVSLTLCKRGKVSGTKKPKRALGDALLQREGLSEYKVRIVRHMDISDKKT